MVRISKMHGHPHLLAFFIFTLLGSCSTFSGIDQVTPVRPNIERNELHSSLHKVQTLRRRDICVGGRGCDSGRIPLSSSDFNVIVGWNCCRYGYFCCGTGCAPNDSKCCGDADIYCTNGLKCCGDYCIEDGSDCCDDALGFNCPYGTFCCQEGCAPNGSSCCPANGGNCASGMTCCGTK
jgi:hypothetical protein